MARYSAKIDLASNAVATTHCFANCLFQMKQLDVKLLQRDCIPPDSDEWRAIRIIVPALGKIEYQAVDAGFAIQIVLNHENS